MPLPGCVRSMNAVAVALPGPRVGQVAVPDEVGLLGQPDSLLAVPIGVEQAQVDGVGVLAEDREVDARSVPGGAERVRVATPDSHGHLRCRRPGARSPAWSSFVEACPEPTKRVVGRSSPPANPIPLTRDGHPRSSRRERPSSAVLLPPPEARDLGALWPMRPADLLAVRHAGAGWLPMPGVRTPGL